MSIEVMKQALNALEWHTRGKTFTPLKAQRATAALRQAITEAEQAQPEQLARLGWQEIDCPICGGGARAFPKPEQAQPDAFAKFTDTLTAELIEMPDEQVLEGTDPEAMHTWGLKLLTAAKQAGGRVEQAQPEAYLVYAKGNRKYFTVTLDVKKVPEIYLGGEAVPLYTSPPQRKPLTDEQLRDALRQCQHDTVENLRVRWLYAKEFARAIEAAHGIKEKT